MPAGLVVAALAFFACGAIALVAKVSVFLRPDPNAGSTVVFESEYAPGRPIVVDPAPDGGMAEWVGWLLPVVVMVLAFLIRGGGNGVRVTLTVFAALYGLGVVSAVADGGSVAGVLLLALITLAVVLLYLPGSTAYVREVRRASART